MKQRRTIIGVAIFFTICLIIYAFLGGLKEVKLSVISDKVYHMVGNQFNGQIESDTLKSLFFGAKTLLEKKQVDGTLAILYFKDAEQGRDSIECFTGILLTRKPGSVPEGMEYKAFSSKGAVKARFDGHRLVTPNPSQIKEKVDRFATQNNLKLQRIFVEKYFSDNAIEIDYLLH